jgi:hypothetical protein
MIADAVWKRFEGLVRAKEFSLPRKAENHYHNHRKSMATPHSNNSANECSNV